MSNRRFLRCQGITYAINEDVLARNIADLEQKSQGRNEVEEEALEALLCLDAEIKIAKRKYRLSVGCDTCSTLNQADGGAINPCIEYLNFLSYKNKSLLEELKPY